MNEGTANTASVQPCSDLYWEGTAKDVRTIIWFTVFRQLAAFIEGNRRDLYSLHTVDGECWAMIMEPWECGTNTKGTPNGWLRRTGHTENTTKRDRTIPIVGITCRSQWLGGLRSGPVADRLPGLGAIDICVLWVPCVVRGLRTGLITLPEEYESLDNEEALAHLGVLRHGNENTRVGILILATPR